MKTTRVRAGLDPRSGPRRRRSCPRRRRARRPRPPACWSSRPRRSSGGCGRTRRDPPRWRPAQRRISRGVWSGTGGALFGFQLETDIGGRRRVRQRTDRHVGRAGGGELGQALEGDAAGEFNLGAAARAADRLLDDVGRQIIDEDDISAGGESLAPPARDSAPRPRSASPAWPLSSAAPPQLHRRRAEYGCP